ncbi:putative cell division protein FtsL (putative) [Fructilactobacillus fructivorans]|nr:putative cell division protein FtsL (putative) [Fructilactobacillus fructivorans]KRN39559.1 putative cell division protein FtsL (putative) [Fructilactobacillus fructivorans]KRN43278.1 putative cell division protein FtsL (putative) [Fructilactobacillus fructivorans]
MGTLAQNGLARKEYSNGNAYETYRRNQINSHQPTAPQKEHRFTPKLEVTVLVVGCAVVFLMAIALVWTRVSLSGAQQTLQDTATRSTRIRNTNTGLKQQIDELQSSSRLDKVAKGSGLKLSNDQIRNITK